MLRWPGSSGKKEESSLTQANRPTLSWSALRIDEHSQVEHAGEIELSSLDPYEDRGSAQRKEIDPKQMSSRLLRFSSKLA